MLLYHIVPETMSGTHLHPLNILKKTHPELFNTYIKKYEGREHVTEQVIPILDCVWSDTIFLLPISPHEVNSVRKSSGLQPIHREWLEVDSEKMDKERLILYKHRPKWCIDSQDEKEEYVMFSNLTQDQKNNLCLVPEYARKSMRRPDSNRMIFAWMPHILFRGKYRN